jgi:hypothetical protein
MNKIKISIVMAKIIYQFQKIILISLIFILSQRKFIKTNNKISFIVQLGPQNHLINFLLIINRNWELFYKWELQNKQLNNH